MSQKVPGSDRVLSNGATGAYFTKTKADGTQGRVFRIYKSSRAAVQGAIDARKNPRQITQAQAQQAFDKYYARTRTIKRGPRKGQPVFASPRGRKAARTYDLTHTSNNPDKRISDARYLHNPHAYEFQGVDTGSKVRKPLSIAQREALARGQAAIKAKNAAKRAARGQAGGYWW